MNMKEVRKRAADMGVRPQPRRKADVIRAIQSAEGNTPCFATGRSDCDQARCYWREDCLSQSLL